MRIILLDCITTPYNGKIVREKAIGGIATCTACLAEALAKTGHDVTVLNNLEALQNGEHFGVKWHNENTIDPTQAFDIAIANNDAKLFDTVKAKHHVIWLHNRVLLEKTIRKGRLLPLLKYRPTAVFLGEKQKKNTHILHPFRKRLVIAHGLPEAFLQQNTTETAKPAQQALYCSQAYRGVAEMIELWVKYIHPECPDAEFKAYIGDEFPQDLSSKGMSRKDLARANIRIMPKVSKAELVEDLERSRMMLYPGHKDETFCLAAAEASALGIPIVTYGRGSLSERVQNKKNGFVVEDKNQEEFAKKAITLFKDDQIWQQMSQNAQEQNPYQSWNKIAQIWEENVIKDFK